MTENLAKRPSKGILKSSSSFEKPEAPTRKKHKETKWDEMNIIATLHPPDKDYGHMKIEEPKTPYNWVEGVGDETDSLDAEVLAEKIKLGAHELPKSLVEESDSAEEDEEDIDETPEEREKRKAFESKRKAHYNEYYAVKLARQLMSTEEDEDEEDVVMADGGDPKKVIEVAAADSTTAVDNSRQPSTSRSPSS